MINHPFFFLPFLRIKFFFFSRSLFYSHKIIEFIYFIFPTQCDKYYYTIVCFVLTFNDDDHDRIYQIANFLQPVVCVAPRYLTNWFRSISKFPKEKDNIILPIYFF